MNVFKATTRPALLEPVIEERDCDPKSGEKLKTKLGKNKLIVKNSVFCDLDPVE